MAVLQQEQLVGLLKRYEEEMIQLRRHFHENPELSFEEIETPKTIAAFHRALGHEVREGVGGNGVVAKLVGAKAGKTVALRADFDALAITEETGLPFRSKIKGRMHACGHDGHTASLLILAKALNQMKDNLAGTIVFIHQHAEELAPGGAKSMIADGCLEGVDVIFGTHLWAPTELGKVQTAIGPFMAAADGIYMKIKGKGGHGSNPSDTKDSILLAAQFITNLQQLVARRINPLRPAVVSIGHIEALNPFNVIADQVYMKGTVRTFHEEERDLLEREIEELLKATCYLTKADYEYEFRRGYPPVVNHAAETEHVMASARKVADVEAVEFVDPTMGGEDFAYYLEEIPGAFFFTGAKNPQWQEVYPHHHPKFDIDERSLRIAANVLGQATLDYLANDH
ncbi:peptidase M20 [Lysinibacillus sphaericus]|uniref:amidohydrolase n=1 Tax=Lysinibacillus TaxID=400634 RepID=UPI00084A967C|nr:amidohydrolase [Lysinibacillus sphaericus]OEC02700.1 peptidase M20 [Lysinibacillus sphaericus]